MDRNTLNILTNRTLDADYRKTCWCLYFLIGKLEVSGSKQHLSSLIWGDHDLLFPIEQVQYINPSLQHAQQNIYRIPGGAHFHPIERPWSIADAIHTIVTEISSDQSDMHVILVDMSNYTYLKYRRSYRYENFGIVFA